MRGVHIPPSVCTLLPTALLTRHDGALGEVAGEEVVVNGDALVAHRQLLLLPLHHTVHQQEGVPMGRRR